MPRRSWRIAKDTQPVTRSQTQWRFRRQRLKRDRRDGTNWIREELDYLHCEQPSRY